MTTTEPIESWRRTWRAGFVPVLSTQGLTALAAALRTDDYRLTQGSTTTPPPLQCVQDFPVEAACALGYCGAAEAGGFCTDSAGSVIAARKATAATVGTVEQFFAETCFKADQLLGEPAACRWFLNWFDDTPRSEMRRELLAEVQLALAARGAEVAAAVEAAPEREPVTCPF